MKTLFTILGYLIDLCIIVIGLIIGYGCLVAAWKIFKAGVVTAGALLCCLFFAALALFCLAAPVWIVLSIIF